MNEETEKKPTGRPRIGGSRTRISVSNNTTERSEPLWKQHGENRLDQPAASPQTSANLYNERSGRRSERSFGNERPYNSEPRPRRPYTPNPYRDNAGEDRPSGYNRQSSYGQRNNGGDYNREFRHESGDERQPYRSYAPRPGYNDREYSREGDGYNRANNSYGRENNAYGRGGGGGSYNRQSGGRPRNANGHNPATRKPFRPNKPGYAPNAKYSVKKRLKYSEAHIDPTQPLRLNKYMANAGICSRRDADKYILAGVITVNGEVVTELGAKVLRTDEIKFHNNPVKMEKKMYVLLNKPKDYVTTSDDPQKRKTVMELISHACEERIYPVGRLDRNTTGVLLLTNDGDMTAKLTHPQFLKKKIYHVYLSRNVSADDLRQIAEGIMLEDGLIKADAIEYASPTDKKQIGIEIHSGRNRVVRRIFEHLGYKVTKLDRVYFAGLTKKNLRRGDWRYLTEEEVSMLRMGAFE